MLDIEKLKFDEKGLIPAIVVDDETDKVLTLAYMNRESLAISMEKKLTCFWSRSRQELWLKGETSGNYQHIVSITADCDYDALEVRVIKDGPACHLGTDSCFTNPILGEGQEKFRLEDLYQLLEGRKRDLPEGSYTSYLFQKGIDKILKKVGEESTEVIIAGKADDKAETVYEIADLAYHVLVLMVQMGITVEDIRKELAGRHVIDHKDQQQVPDELAGKPVRIRQRRQMRLAGIQEGVHDGEKIQRINLFQLLPQVISKVPDAQVNVLSPGGIACHKAAEHEEKADRRGGAIGGGVPEKDPALRVADIYV